jgi:hypothetical protein
VRRPQQRRRARGRWRRRAGVARFPGTRRPVGRRTRPMSRAAGGRNVRPGHDYGAAVRGAGCARARLRPASVAPYLLRWPKPRRTLRRMVRIPRRVRRRLRVGQAGRTRWGMGRRRGRGTQRARGTRRRA